MVDLGCRVRCAVMIGEPDAACRRDSMKPRLSDNLQFVAGTQIQR